MCLAIIAITFALHAAATEQFAEGRTWTDDAFIVRMLKVKEDEGNLIMYYI